MVIETLYNVVCFVKNKFDKKDNNDDSNIQVNACLA